MKSFNVYRSCAFLLFLFCNESFITTCSAQSVMLYATTEAGGSHGGGTIITFNPTTNTESVVWSFGGITDDGAEPFGNLVFDANNGLFYGMTWSGGKYSSGGSIYSFNPVTNIEDTLHDLGSGTDGKQPYGNFVYDTATELFYGMTHIGGKYARGTIISFNAANNTEDTIYSFVNSSDAQAPYGNFTYDSTNGLFYAMTSAGGGYGVTNSGLGTIISFDPKTNAESVLWSFGNGTDGATPEGSLVYGPSNGLLYGMTESGGKYGTGYGAIISFNPANNTEDTLHSFGGGMDGKTPLRDFIYDTYTGLFYGMTSGGGKYGFGAIISFDPTSNTEDTVHSLGGGTGVGADGRNPWGNLIYNASNGLFYGLTEQGGQYNSGTIFSFNPNTNTENVVWTFGVVAGDGYTPRGSFVLYSSITTGITGINKSSGISIYPNPSQGLFTISGKGFGTQGNVVVYNMMGQQVYSTQYSMSNTQFSIDLSNQPDGIYMLRITNSDGAFLAQKKIVKAQ